MTLNQPAVRSPWPRWLSLLLGMGTAITLFLQLSKPPASTDLWWHLALGKQVLDSGSLVVDHSQFSWSAATPHHVYNTWLSDIFLHLVDRLAGNGGLVALRYLIFGGVALLAWLYARQRAIQHNPVTWLIVFVGLEMSSGNSEIKPELFSLGFMALTVWLYYHIRNAGERGYQLFYAFPLIAVIWSNVHGAFFIASLFLATVLLGELLNARFSPQLAMPRPWRKHFMAALLLCLPALLVNPYGYELPLHIVQNVLSSNIVALKYVLAYRPTYFFNDPPLFLLDYLIIAMLMFVLLVWQRLKQRQTDWVVILSFIAYCTLYVRMGRATYFLGPVFLFAALDLLAHRQGSWLWPAIPRGRLLVGATSLALVSALVLRVLLIHECNLRHPLRLASNMLDSSKYTLVLEADYIEQNLPGKRIGNLYEDGGYLMYRLWPERLTMIDPRAFPFSDWIDRYFRFVDGGPEADEFIKEFTADFWVIRYEKADIFQWFVDSEAWRIAFLGPTGGIFVPATDQPQTVTIAPAISQFDDSYAISKALIPALKFRDLTFAERLYTAAASNLDRQCTDNEIFITEMNDIITGMRFFHEENYVEAAKWLGKPKKFLHGETKAARGLVLLASRKHAEGDEQGARELVIQSFDMTPTQTIVDFYNLMVAEWHYVHTLGDSSKSESKATWLQLADFILVQKDELGETYRPVLEVAQAMKEGRYDGSAQFMVLGTIPQLSTEEKSAAETPH